MPEKKAIQRAHRDKAQGKSASTQAGEFVKTEIAQEKKGSGAAHSQKQAVAIGLSEARRAGVAVRRAPGRYSLSRRIQECRQLK